MDRTKMIKWFRKSLHPDWTKLNYKKTDKALNKKQPFQVKSYDSNDIYALPGLEELSNKSFKDIVLDRRSRRKYSEGELSLNKLAYLCDLTSSVRETSETWIKGVIPTGGATKALDAYIYINNVSDLPRGLYYYRPIEKDLQKLPFNISNDDIDEALKKQLRGAQVVFIWGATPYRTEYKYSYTAHKMIAMEVGHACQNVYLATEALDLGCVAIAAYDQKKFDQIMKFDGEKEFVIYAATVGKK
ncbi:MAG: SagB/ThcOx family dehydrogenase [Candidatus Izimaplasma sp.]|nr:SagB/ThcOx family dehydrogenase [Candidatus Izimaplasma bacterium]